ncbi:MAG: poly-gamma-glutamate system protein [Candidatus Lernaella stagnicola]|nr:poly-gamma-glutamate system protein [Candidatus Lernaella stagnicola]
MKPNIVAIVKRERRSVLFVLLCSVILVTLECGLKIEQRPHFAEKIAAARLARQAFDVIKTARCNRGYEIDPELDPARSGLVGDYLTQVTSNTGLLESKHTSINPNFAALFFDFLVEAGVTSGDTVGVAFSGSYPALNIAVVIACETLGARPVITSSASASNWGANVPDFMWLDMERVLVEQGIISHRSIAASLGGIEDVGFGMSPEGRRLLREAIERNGVPFLDSADRHDGSRKRVELYESQSAPGSLAAFVNVGGGAAVVGTLLGKRTFKVGVNQHAPNRAERIDSVVSYFATRGVPIIHLVYVDFLAEKFALPVAPTEMPAVGEGSLFWKRGYYTTLAIVYLFVTMFSSILLLRHNNTFIKNNGEKRLIRR